jgi:hypothetical protein
MKVSFFLLGYQIFVIMSPLRGYELLISFATIMTSLRDYNHFIPSGF